MIESPSIAELRPQPMCQRLDLMEYTHKNCISKQVESYKCVPPTLCQKLGKCHGSASKRQSPNPLLVIPARYYWICLYL